MDNLQAEVVQLAAEASEPTVQRDAQELLDETIERKTHTARDKAATEKRVVASWVARAARQREMRERERSASPVHTPPLSLPPLYVRSACACCPPQELILEQEYLDYW